MHAYLNGRIMPEAEATVSVNDRGWLYGDAVFETLRTYGPRVFKLKEHLARLERSASLIDITLPMATGELAAAVYELLSTENLNGDIMVRITVSRGVGGAGIFPVKPPQPTVVIQLRNLPPYPPQTFTVGWRLVIAGTRRNSPTAIDPLIKSTNFLNNVLAKREASLKGADDALMLNQRGFVAEGTTSNFFIIEGGEVATPTPADGILPGITRELVIDLARAAGLTVREKSINVDSVFAADEAFLTLTSAGIIPVTAIDGRGVGTGRPGGITGALGVRYNEYISAFRRGEVE